MRLKKWMMDNKITQNKMAEDLNYTRTYIYRIVTERMKPGKHMADAILRYTEGKVDMLSPDYDKQAPCVCSECNRPL